MNASDCSVNGFATPQNCARRCNAAPKTRTLPLLRARPRTFSRSRAAWRTGGYQRGWRTHTAPLPVATSPSLACRKHNAANRQDKRSTHGRTQQVHTPWKISTSTTRTISATQMQLHNKQNKHNNNKHNTYNKQQTSASRWPPEGARRWRRCGFRRGRPGKAPPRWRDPPPAAPA